MNNKLKFGIAAAIIIAVIFTSVPLLATSTGSTNTATNNPTTAAEPAQQKTVRIGYFPNLTHAQAVIGLGNGDFQKALGSNIEVKTQIFNAGPSAIEALFANQIDVTYIGPNPAINGYVQSEGKALRIVAGAASGGASFVVRNDAGINSVADFAGKKFSSPQLGNTQDVALRKYLLDNGYKTKENGGNVEVLPASNGDIFTLLVKKDIDGAWVPEPWVAKHVKEANASIFLDERDLWPNGDFVTAHIIVRTEYLNQNPDVIEKLIKAHIDETNWINSHPDEARRVFNEQLQVLTGKTIPDDEFKDALSRLKLTYDPIKDSLVESANAAYDLGYLRQKPDLSEIYDLTILNKVLRERGLQEIT
ncbi:ABC transporter substrate-binding protein [Nitrososphaera sp.]|uniref:ABC transporter substrate-binding protein n=1 Tax=Nitrososphaera sp. TaxID=1971748 RepID=UPI0017AAD173|nr:ABC transporter substrate-binding protein [Nitrososphaera sp.]NWG37795.1 ABC transporter substrate-binding protein [Nitrososphaera sp.]